MAQGESPTSWIELDERKASQLNALWKLNRSSITFAGTASLAMQGNNYL